MSEERRRACLVLSLTQARAGSSIMRRLGDLSPEQLLEMDPREAQAATGMTDRSLAALEEVRSSFDQQSFERSLEGKGARAATPGEADYPSRLTQSPDPPPALYIRGALPSGSPVAVVGSRSASVGGVEVARRLGQELGGSGVAVVSGLALGVDAAAHEGALQGKGYAVGVLGCGIDRVYPAANRSLYERVAQTGALISEYPPGEPPLKWRFPARNRIIAGVSEAVVVVEAPEKSGALITARHALEMGREVWAVPGPVTSARWRGSNRLLADGAGVLWDIPEFVESISPYEERGGEAFTEDALPLELPADEAGVLGGVGFEPTPVDAISERAGFEMSRVISALSMLELKGYVARDVSGAFTRRRG